MPCQYCHRDNCAEDDDGNFCPGNACDGLRAAWKRDEDHEGYCDGLASRREDHQRDE